MTRNQTRVFLSYSIDERPFVRAVADEMRHHGVETWFDDTELAPGTRWRETLADALASSKVVVVFIGRAPESPWMNFEIGAAVGAKKRVVPVFLTQSARKGAPSVLSHFAGIDASNLKPEQVAEQIAEAVGTGE